MQKKFGKKKKKNYFLDVEIFHLILLMGKFLAKTFLRPTNFFSDVEIFFAVKVFFVYKSPAFKHLLLFMTVHHFLSIELFFVLLYLFFYF